jgi:hypothetical protein
MADRPNQEIQTDIDTLEEFADACRYYNQAPDEKGEVPREFVGNRATLRQLILRKLGPVEAIMNELGTNGFGLISPVGGPPVSGVSALAFADENPHFANAEPPVHQMILDAVERSIGLLQHEQGPLGRARTAVRLPGRPRGHFPRLILGRVLRSVPRWAAMIERIVFFLAAIAAIVAVVGTALGWWSGSNP